MVIISEGGLTRRVSAAEAHNLHLTRKGVADDNAAARSSSSSTICACVLL
jgi:hypothetical protein